jgi:hypothetical protein
MKGVENNMKEDDERKNVEHSRFFLKFLGLLGGPSAHGARTGTVSA